MSKFKTTYGSEIKPLGLCKIKLIDIIGNSIRLNNVKINQAVALKNFFSKIMVIILMINLFEIFINKRLFLTYQWNNLLHNEVERILTFALESDSNILRISVYLFYYQ